MNLSMKSIFPAFLLVLLHCRIEAGRYFSKDRLVRYSAVPKGSKVTLVGLLHEPHDEVCSKVWLKEEQPILKRSSAKYTFLNSDTTLVIHDFSVADVGPYLFIYSRNNKSDRVVFELELITMQGQHWYQKDSKHVGTVIGMSFLFLIILALVYYCCSKDVDTVFPSLQFRKLAFQGHPYNNHNDNIYSGGINFSPGVHVANNNGRRKTSKEVRRESLNMLGIASRRKLTKNSKKNKRNKELARRVSLSTAISPPSPSFL